MKKTHVRLWYLALVVAIALAGILGTTSPTSADGPKPTPAPQTIPPELLPQVKEMLQAKLQGGGISNPLVVSLVGNLSARAGENVVLVAQIHPRMDGISQIVPVRVEYRVDGYEEPVTKYGMLSDDFLWGISWGIPGPHEVEVTGCVDLIGLCASNVYHVFVYPWEQTVSFDSPTTGCDYNDCHLRIKVGRPPEWWEIIPPFVMVEFDDPTMKPVFAWLRGPMNFVDIRPRFPGQIVVARIVWSSVFVSNPNQTTVYVSFDQTPTPTPAITKVPVTPYPTSRPIGSPTPWLTPTPAPPAPPTGK